MKTTRKMRFEVYRAKDGWRWNCTASNGRILADGGEAYRTRAGAIKRLAAFIDKTLASDYIVILPE